MTHGASGKNKRRIARLKGGLLAPFFCLAFSNVFGAKGFVTNAIFRCIFGMKITE
jgi:hypothetical protein